MVNTPKAASRRRKPARAAAPRATAAVAAPAAEVMDSAAVEVTPLKQRRRRASVGGFKQKLEAPARPGYYRRWVNDDGARLGELHGNDYEFVHEGGVKTDGLGQRVSRIVGTKANGEPMHAYLMEIPDEFRQEDLRAKEEINRKVDDALRSNSDPSGRLDPNTTYGRTSIGTI